MEISKLIEGLEKLFYNFLMLIILLPKTLFKIFIPRWSSNYIDQQFALDEEKRFNDSVSPVLLFILLVALPVYYSLNFGTYLGPLDTDRKDFFSRLATNSALSVVDKLLIITVLFNIYPVLFACVLNWHKKESLNKQSFKKGYYNFLYTFCTIYISFLFLFDRFFLTGMPGEELLLLFAFLLFIYANISAFVTNVHIIKIDLGISTIKASLYVVVVYPFVSIIYFYLIGSVLEVLMNNMMD